jgi:hypothetical protein
MTNFKSHINYQLARLNPGKLPVLDLSRNTNREYLVALTVLQLRPVFTHLFFCFVIREYLDIFTKLK